MVPRFKGKVSFVKIERTLGGINKTKVKEE